jgi:hypothetical protein
MIAVIVVMGFVGAYSHSSKPSLAARSRLGACARTGMRMTGNTNDDDDDDDDDDVNSTPRIGRSQRPVPDVPPQLARSRALANEGLDGFPNRVGQLLYLGATFWVGLPAVLAVLVSLGASLALYSNLGDRFIHGGAPSGLRRVQPDAESVHAQDASDSGGWAPSERIPLD